MGVIWLNCEQCGGKCDLDDTREFGFCKSCGNKMIISKDVINNTYNTTHNVTNIDNTRTTIIKNIYGKADKDAEEYIAAGDKWMKLGTVGKANEMYTKAVDECPDSLLAWRKRAGSIDPITYNYLGKCVTDFNRAWGNAYKLAEHKAEIVQEWLVDLNKKFDITKYSQSKISAWAEILASEKYQQGYTERQYVIFQMGIVRYICSIKILEMAQQNGRENAAVDMLFADKNFIDTSVSIFKELGENLFDELYEVLTDEQKTLIECKFDPQKAQAIEQAKAAAAKQAEEDNKLCPYTGKKAIEIQNDWKLQFEQQKGLLKDNSVTFKNLTFAAVYRQAQSKDGQGSADEVLIYILNQMNSIKKDKSQKYLFGRLEHQVDLIKIGDKASVKRLQKIIK